MPTEYEGSAGSIQSLTDEWEKKILAYRDYFLEEENYGVDEKKRIGRPKNPESLFGMDGTFRQLQFDWNVPLISLLERAPLNKINDTDKIFMALAGRNLIDFSQGTDKMLVEAERLFVVWLFILKDGEY